MSRRKTSVIASKSLMLLMIENCAKQILPHAREATVVSTSSRRQERVMSTPSTNMNLTLAMRDYFIRMIAEVSGMKVMLFDKDTVSLVYFLFFLFFFFLLIC
jgi:hypothetical protein